MHRIQTFCRHSIVPIDVVLATIEAALSSRDRSGIPRPKKLRVEINGVNVGVGSLRLQTFLYKGTTCIACGVKATYFAIERDTASEVNDRPYHLNLWGVKDDGEPVLFTHDHTLARSLGGKDRLSNTETMCCFCNWEKGEREQIEKNNLTLEKSVD